MAVIRIAEFSQLAVSPGGTAQVGATPAIAYQSFTFTGASSLSNTFNVATKFIRVHTDAIVSIDIRTNPVAVVAAGTPATMRMGANQTEYFGVNPGDKLAAIVDT